MSILNNTYINEGYTDTWPFTSGQYLPFGQGTVAGLGICVAPVEESHAVAARATSVSVSADSVSVALEILVDSAVVLSVLLTARTRNFGAIAESYASVHGTEGGYEFHCWMAAGAPQQLGVFNGAFTVDPSCINSLPPSVYTGVGTSIQVNNVSYAVPETLGVNFTGDFTIAMTDTASVSLSCSLGRGEGAASSSSTRYSMVDSINNRKLVESSEQPLDNYTGTLELWFSVNSSKISSIEDMAGVISFSVDNALSYSDGARHPEYNDEHGEVTVLTVHGTHEFPNCYNSEDDEA